MDKELIETRLKEQEVYIAKNEKLLKYCLTIIRTCPINSKTFNHIRNKIDRIVVNVTIAEQQKEFFLKLKDQ